jgi:trehalose synthase
MTAKLKEVTLSAQSIERFRSLVAGPRVEVLHQRAAQLRSRLQDHTLWNINSTAVGGGVAEMLRPLLGYARGLYIDARWLVIQGNPDFFRLTKRLHHALHGAAGDGMALGDAARQLYEATLAPNAAALAQRVQPGDVVILHDPQTAGLATALLERNVHVVWRCHIGQDVLNDEVQAGWAFLAPYLEQVPRFVFSRPAYVPAQLDHGRSRIIQPCIDAFAAKNQPLDEATTQAILVETGLLEGPPPADATPRFEREDGRVGTVERAADIIRLGRAPRATEPLVVQVSRWDSLKDPVGVLRGFAQMLSVDPSNPAHLLLAGPNVTAVADDPEGAQVFRQVERAWRDLPHEIRRRVHLASLPVTDVEENHAIVNAIQRHAAVVVQKSLCEGFGLTVTEAMWKARPILASAVGGIKDQIRHEKEGLLLDDPRDPDAFAAALAELLGDPAFASALGLAARERVRDEFLGIRSLLQFGDLLLELLPEE